ncbi:hypothetical protein Cgig2_025220 [Carnegiea gigantea]|uniref:Uncharacterized protein n=1 Tax=Carnegiea gigantea TaxID=171969 RepID=A0A9Q1KT14_9CARY|nr:hypothetical protein Cgig2_025220 [Carnegiea gigantea]
MSKIHPHLAPPSPPSSSSSSSSSSSDVCFSERETFTIWMKSLILEGKGCTVFNSKGQAVYRVDNYNSKCCDKHKVLLMDSHGRVLLTILRKKFRLLADWECYREENTKGASWWFRVQKSWRLTKKLFKCEVTVNLDHNNKSSMLKIEKGKSKLSSCRIVDKSRGLLAEMKRKQSIEGVFFGNDVLTMVIEPNVDHSLIMGLMVAHGLIECRI